MIMGCYAIGVTRVMAAVIEQRHDANGIVWPVAISPFHVVVSVLDAGNEELVRAGQQAYEQLLAAGRDVLLDDREQSPGSKLKDADLIGVPVQVVVGKAWTQERRLEVVERPSKTRHKTEPGELAALIDKLLDKLSTSQ